MVDWFVFSYELWYDAMLCVWSSTICFLDLINIQFEALYFHSCCVFNHKSLSTQNLYPPGWWFVGIRCEFAPHIPCSIPTLDLMHVCCGVLLASMVVVILDNNTTMQKTKVGRAGRGRGSGWHGQKWAASNEREGRQARSGGGGQSKEREGS